jgi:hypothetical protein
MEKGQIVKIPVEIVDKRHILDKGWLYTVKRPDGQFRRYYEDKMHKLCQTQSIWSKLLSYFN